MIKIIESPREAMQGIVPFIPTEKKVQYINALLKVGFDTVEIGSLVSLKAIPQMSDTLKVLESMGMTETRSKKMVLVVNPKGAQTAAVLGSVDSICFPFSLSPRFTELNLNSTLEKQTETVIEISEICNRLKKEFIVYISMSFGNPYGDEWNIEILTGWVEKLKKIGVKTIPLSNVSVEIDRTLIAEVFSTLTKRFPEIEFGLHLHTTNADWKEKVEAAYNNGCRRFDSVLHGMGGCPMTGKEMLGNLATENLISFLENKNLIPVGFDHQAFADAGKLTSDIFKDNSKKSILN